MIYSAYNNLMIIKKNNCDNRKDEISYKFLKNCIFFNKKNKLLTYFIYFTYYITDFLYNLITMCG